MSNKLLKYFLIALAVDILAGIIAYILILLPGMESFGIIYYLLFLIPFFLIVQLVTGFVLALKPATREKGQGILLPPALFLLIGFALCGNAWLR
ncbi:MAG: hypothetical protein ABIT96_10085 [Ferruginibacter sp.]